MEPHFEQDHHQAKWLEANMASMSYPQGILMCDLAS